MNMACDWNVGDELIVTSSMHHGFPEMPTLQSMPNRHHRERRGFFITSVSTDCTEFGIHEPLGEHHIGIKTVEEGGIEIDMRSRVLMVTRNVRVEGGDHPLWDSISGVNPWKAEYGGTIFTRPAYKETKLGWDPSQIGFEKYGQWHFPEGKVEQLNWMEFSMMGKQKGNIIDMSFECHPHVTVSYNQKSLSVIGVVDRNPISGGGGLLTQGQWAHGLVTNPATGNAEANVVYTDNILIGIAQNFEPLAGGDHLVERNHFFGSTAGSGLLQYCREWCTPTKITVFGGKGNLEVADNWWHGGYTAVQSTRRADETNLINRRGIDGGVFNYYESNKIMGAGTGIELIHEMLPGPVHIYKSSNGVLQLNPEGGATNVITAECGIGLFSYKRMVQYPNAGSSPGSLDTHDPNYPAVCNKDPENYGRWHCDKHAARIGDGGDGSRLVIIGRTRLLQEVTEFDYCDVGPGNWGTASGHGFIIGGQGSGWLRITDTDYSGIQYGPRGGKMFYHNPVQPEFNGYGRWEINGATLLGFTGVDACGKKNVAIGNAAAGNGEWRNLATGHNTLFGAQLCPPLMLRKVKFGGGTPNTAKFKFSHGLHDNSEGYQPGYAKCEVYDFEGALVGAENLPEDGRPAMLMSASQTKIPERMKTDCTNWHIEEASKEDDLSVNPDAGGSCLWWIREYNQLMGAVMDPMRQGIIKNDGVSNINYEPSPDRGGCQSIDSIGMSFNTWNNMLICEKYR